MRILVCGGREFRDYDHLARTLDAFRNAADLMGTVLTVITGGASGADALVETWASVWAQRSWIIQADWTKHGKAAGPIRNQRMLDEGKPDLVIAFPGGRGTEDMVRRARKAGVPVLRVEP